MPPSPPHGGALSANDVTSLQAALSLSGDFVEFVSERQPNTASRAVITIRYRRLRVIASGGSGDAMMRFAC
jgi:hypothetical protein